MRSPRTKVSTQSGSDGPLLNLLDETKVSTQSGSDGPLLNLCACLNKGPLLPLWVLTWAASRNVNIVTVRSISLRLRVIFCAIVLAWLAAPLFHTRAEDQSIEKLIDAALYTRAEFFGAQAVVPYPTAEARNRLADLQKSHPDQPRISQELAKLNEQLGQYDEAEQNLKTALASSQQTPPASLVHPFIPSPPHPLTALADFYHRRARFADEAATLEKILAAAPAQERAAWLNRLLELARVQQFDKYLAPAFTAQLIADDPSSQQVVSDFVARLQEKQEYETALGVVRQYRAKFPEHEREWLDKEVELLDLLKRGKEAEQVYCAAFDPFWPEARKEKFYEFLSDHDRRRAYAQELRHAWRRNPADFAVAIRLIDSEYSSYSNHTTPVILAVERARAARRVVWQPQELAAAARLLLKEQDADTATRFLYTLYNDGRLQKGDPLRGQILYQLFVMLRAAEDERLPLTRGDLRFYANVAQADPHPGIIGGVLSLIFSDGHSANKFANVEAQAVPHFNRAAAQRIFDAYRQEFPTAPALAQMYLDMVQAHLANKETDQAAALLQEFAGRYGNAEQFPAVALKLADAYRASEKHDQERAVYQQILDYLGQHKGQNARLIATPTPTPRLFAPDPNAVTVYASDTPAYSYNAPQGKYENHLTAPDTVTYEDVLNRYINSLNGDKRTSDILALYGGEIRKYPDEESLYEQMLSWLSQNRLATEELRVFREAAQRFPTTNWRDRLARWYIGQQRNEEFADYSRAVLSKLDDAETTAYLAEFINSKSSATPGSFDANLYLGLYTQAHQRFPRNLTLVRGLLTYYREHQQWDVWRALMAEYYFTDSAIRGEFLQHLARRNELGAYLEQARACQSGGVGEKGSRRETLRVAEARANNLTTQRLASRLSHSLFSPTPLLSHSPTPLLVYKLFRADAAVWVTNYEEAVEVYRELNRLYPHTPAFEQRLMAFTRSLGQTNRKFLEESASVAHETANANPTDADARTRAGEIAAELGDYPQAQTEWQQLINVAPGEPNAYLDAATVAWDYYQYDDALRIIAAHRRQSGDATRYAFQAGAIYEAKHNLPQALQEYAEALGGYVSAYGEPSAGYSGAKRRLAQLYARPGVPQQIRAAVNQARQSADRRHAFAVALGYAELLEKVEQKEEAAASLRAAIASADDTQLLEEARSAFSRLPGATGETLALQRLATLAGTSRNAISYRLQLADAYHENGQHAASAAVLDGLTRSYPNSYGVLDEAASGYWRLGQRARTVQLLQSAVARARGRYSYAFARRLAAHHLDMDNAAAAASVLESLHSEDPRNTEVFHELARAYLRQRRPDALRARLEATVSALQKSGLDRREMLDTVESLRTEAIDTYTRLGDYRAAVAQHIEIINRNPEDETPLDNAIRYTRRYGGADALLDYYLKTSAAAYKNYRWNLVLARLYEADKDWGHAAANYRAALQNNPEQVELYDALAVSCANTGDQNAAVDALNKACEISGDDAAQVKLFVAALERAGRREEAAAARQKLPAPVVTPTPAVADQFRAAANATEAEQVQKYREAFAAFRAAPLKTELRPADISGYVHALQAVDDLPTVALSLWEVRAELIKLTDADNAKQAAAARARLQTLDGAFYDSLGSLTAEHASDAERAALRQDWQQRIAATPPAADRHGTLNLLQNLAHRAGFGDLAEQILSARKDAAPDNTTRYQLLKTLTEHYEARQAYPQIIALLEDELSRKTLPEGFPAQQIIADNARLLGDDAKELAALRAYAQRPNANYDATLERYFVALQKHSKRDELQDLATHPKPFHDALINFLIGKGEHDLAHQAIAAAPRSELWRATRHAQAALDGREPDAQAYFARALQPRNIGELLAHPPDAQQQLVGTEWFDLTHRYGQWLAVTHRPQARDALPALIEYRPQDAQAQADLGRFYLSQKDLPHAVEHLALAQQHAPDNKKIAADLGAAYFLQGDKTRAVGEWSKIVAAVEPTPDDYALYLRTWSQHGLGAEARERLFSKAAKQINAIPSYLHENSQNAEVKDADSILQTLSASFSPTEKAAQAQFFQRLMAAAPYPDWLPEAIIKGELVAREYFAPFYRELIKRGEGLGDYEYDSDYQEQLHATGNAAEAEAVFDQTSVVEPDEPKSERLAWQQEYLAWQFEQHQPAQQLIAEIENSLAGRYARPAWLRLAHARADLRAGRDPTEELRCFVGVTTLRNANRVALPYLERLNDTAKLLEEEGRDAGALRADAYARALALEQYDVAAMTGLARHFFQAGNTELGVFLLRLLARWDEAAQAELAAQEWIKSFAVNAEFVEKPEPRNDITPADALARAAEVAAEFKQFALALELRQQLYGIAPADIQNRIELARLYSVTQQPGPALDVLAAVIAHRHATRAGRWQAVWHAPEIVGQERLATLAEKLPASEKELAAALLARGDNQALDKLRASSDAYALFYAGLLLTQTEAITAFTAAQRADRDGAAHNAFSTLDAACQLARLYAKQGQPRAALAVVAGRNDLQDNELLELLADAAVQINDYATAINYEQTRLSGLEGDEARRARVRIAAWETKCGLK